MYCPHCGSTITDGGSFCPNCGKSLGNNINQEFNANPNTNPTANPNANARLCCPKCGGKNLQMVSETTSTTTSGGGYSGAKGCLGYLMFGPLGLLCGSCGNGAAKTKNTINHFWVCQSCGEKFKDPTELKENIESLKKRKPLYIPILIGSIIFTVFSAILDDKVGGLWWLVGMGLGFSALSVSGIILMPGVIRKREEELNDLTSKCYRS